MTREIRIKRLLAELAQLMYEKPGRDADPDDLPTTIAILSPTEVQVSERDGNMPTNYDLRKLAPGTVEVDGLGEIHRVWSRNLKMYGIPTGKTRRCQMEGCRGTRIGVRWVHANGKGTYVTWPCTRGLDFVQEEDRISARIM
jgi:hypothetical protein